MKLHEIHDEPLVITMFKKLIDSDQPVFFRNRAGKLTRLLIVRTGLSDIDKQGWWFYTGEGPANSGNAIVWRIGDSINNLTIKKEGDRWILFDKTVKLKEELDEPLVLSLLRRLMKANEPVNVDIMDNQRDFSRWCSGLLRDVITSARPDPQTGRPTDQFVYKLVFLNRGRTDDLRLSQARLEKLHLYRNAEKQFTLSDRKPSPDDEAF